MPDNINKDSILDTTKKILGLTNDYKIFDLDIIIHINTVFSILTQMGVGPEEGFQIEDNTQRWSDFITEPKKLILTNSIKTYMGLKVKNMFDPSPNTSIQNAYDEQIKELENRIYVEWGGY